MTAIMWEGDYEKFTALAQRFRRSFNPMDRAQKNSFCLMYKDASSVGNRYVRWKRVGAHRTVEEGVETIEMDRMYKEVLHGSCEWGHLFEGIYYGLIVGPKTLSAVDRCIEVLANDDPPEDDGKKLKHVNRLGGVNWISKPVYHEWELTAKVGKILSEAFFEDRNNEELYSPEFKYTYSSYSGWSRST